MSSNLAIVIPAYKRQFFEKMLESVAKQTNTNFKVYIGDDASPEDLGSIVEKFTGKIDLLYHRFDVNMGGTDLVAHWERCIALASDEEWIWLFSDDDIMHPESVESFYKELRRSPDKKLFHFNINVIDEDDNVIREAPSFPENLDISTFHLAKWKSKLFSYVVEYIFSKEYLAEKEGFQKFDYAWHSDIATWTKLGHPTGITTIQGGGVNWRRSRLNITPNNRDPKIVKGKLDADIEFSEWVYHFYKKNNLDFSNLHKLHIVKRHVQHLFRCRHATNSGEWAKYIKRQLSILEIPNWYWVWAAYYRYRHVRSLFAQEA